MTATPLRRFRAIWPVIDTDMRPGELMAEALDDLATVGLRHGVRVIPKSARARITEGRTVPGCGGAQLVVVVDVACVRLADADPADAAEPSEPTDTGACGTTAGIKRHRRRGELACEPCRQAYRDYKASRKESAA